MLTVAMFGLTHSNLGQERTLLPTTRGELNILSPEASPQALSVCPLYLAPVTAAPGKPRAVKSELQGNMSIRWLHIPKAGSSLVHALLYYGCASAAKDLTSQDGWHSAIGEHITFTRSSTLRLGPGCCSGKVVAPDRCLWLNNPNPKNPSFYP
jgi:hypothetical protein